MDVFTGYDPKLTYDKDKKTLTLTVVAPSGTAAGIAAKNARIINDWYGWTDSMADLSYSGYLKMSEDGYGDIAFIIMILSDSDHSKALYATMNGEDYYNAAD